MRERGKPNLWTIGPRSGGKQEEYRIDVRTIEELFGQQEEAQSLARAKAGGSLRVRGTSFKETKEEVRARHLVASELLSRLTTNRHIA